MELWVPLFVSVCPRNDSHKILRSLRALAFSAAVSAAKPVRYLPPASQAEVLDVAQCLIQRQPMASGLRTYGLCAGEFVVPQDFDAPLPEAAWRRFKS